MTKFRACIDIHNGKVKQIIGGSLDTENLKTNFVAQESSSFYAQLYKDHNLTGSHVIKLGPGCDEAAILALQTWPNGLQIGGGITSENARQWLENGASKVIVTSYLFPKGDLDWQRLADLQQLIGKDKLVVDLSCRKLKDGSWVVAMDRWQRLTSFKLSAESLAKVAQYCSEFLVHAADVEGLCQGIDEELVKCLGEGSPIPVTYAGGAKSIDDLKLVETLSHGKVDLTYGSALDIFGGYIKFSDLV